MGVGVLQRPESAPGLKAVEQTKRDDGLASLWDLGPGKAAGAEKTAPATLCKSQSLPKLKRPSGLSAAAQLTLTDHFLEDGDKKYFVTDTMMELPKERVMSQKSLLSTIERARPLTAGCGIGTGFNSQKSAVSWWPGGGLKGMTTYRDTFRELPYHPRSGFLVR